MIAPHTVDRATHRITDQSTLHRFLLHLRGDLQCRVERLFGATVRYQLNGLKQASSTNITDMMMIAKTLAERFV